MRIKLYTSSKDTDRDKEQQEEQRTSAASSKRVKLTTSPTSVVSNTTSAYDKEMSRLQEVRRQAAVDMDMDAVNAADLAMKMLRAEAGQQTLGDRLGDMVGASAAGTVGSVANTVGTVQQLLGKEDVDYRLADIAAQDRQRFTESAKENLGNVGQFAVDAGIAGMEMLGDATAGAFLPGGGMTAMALRGFGGSAQEARQSGATLGQQVAYGLGSAGVSVLTEKLGNISGVFRSVYGAGVLDKALTKLTEKPMGKLVASALSEGGEELFEAVWQPVLQKLTYNPEAAYDSEWLSEALYSAAIGSALGGIGGVGDVALNRAVSRAQNEEQTQEPAKPADVFQQEQPEAEKRPQIPTPAPLQDTSEGVYTSEEKRAAEAREMALEMMTGKPEATETIPTPERTAPVLPEQPNMTTANLQGTMPEAPARQSFLSDVQARKTTADEILQRTVQLRNDIQTGAQKLLGKEGYRAFEADFRNAPESDPVETYNQLTRAYNEGVVNQRSTTSTLTADRYNAMFEAGRKDAEASLQAQTKKVGAAVVHNGGIDYADAVTQQYMASGVDRKTAKVIDRTAKALGVRVRFADSVAAGAANAQIENGVVTIEKGNPNPVRFLFGHEITHRMQELAPAEYSRLREAAAEYGWMDAYIKRTQQKYAEHGRSIDSEAAADEAVADFVGTLLEDNGELERFIARSQGDRTLLQKLKDAVHELVVKLKGTEEQKLMLAVEKRLTAALQAASKQAETNAKTQKNTTQTGGVVRFSSKDEVLALDGVDWMDNFSSIKDQIQKHANEINKMTPVAVVDYTAKPVPRLVDVILDEVAKIGGKNMKNGGVSFVFDEAGTQKIVVHAKSPELRAAAMAAPYVAKNGKLIAGQKNHENSGLTTLTYAAPVIINGTTVNAGVAIQFQANGRPRAVNVGLQSGGVFKIDMKKAPKGLDSRVSRYGQGTSLPTMSASENTVAQTKDIVKVENNANFGAGVVNDAKASLKGSASLAREIARIQKEGAAGKRSDADIRADIRAVVDEAYRGFIGEYGAIEPGEKPARDIQVPQKTAKDKKVSQTVRTVLEAGATPDEAVPTIEKMVATGEFSYDTYTDKEAIADAENRIRKVGWAQSLSDWMASVKKGEVSKANTATGWALYNNAANSGDTETAMTILSAMVEHQRSAAQALQATRILKTLSPETQLYGIQKTVNGINEELRQRQKAGNVPVEQWMEKTGELLAHQLGKAVTQKTRKEKTVSQRVLADLRKLARETVQPAAMPADTRTEMDSIYDMFNNQEQYEKALAAAKETVAKEYGDKPEIMEALDQWMQTAFDYTKQFTKEFTGQTEIQIPKELVDKFLSQKDQEGRDEVAREIYRYIGSQLPSTFKDKWNAWRYLAMLGNPRTHVRNILGNAGFAPVVAAKNLTATAIEAAVSRLSGGRLERTKAFVGVSKADRALLKAAWDDYAKVQDAALSGSKYGDFANANQYIEEGRRIFKNKALEAARRGNTKAMEQEDAWFSRPHYAAAMASWCKQNGVTPEQIVSGKAIKPARTYAILEAQKATYRDTNALSQTIGELGRVRADETNPVRKGVGMVMEGILPFRKTPANILARGLEYSPAGLANGIKQALWDVRKGKKTGAEAIDSISAGLTGTGLLALGVYMAAQGLVRGHGDDDEKENDYKDLMGHQAYALELPDGTSATLDWLAPECLPFFIGVNLWEQTDGKADELTLSTMLNSVTTVTEPLLEMSCLQSLNDVFDAVGYAASDGLDGLPAALASAATSYLTQALPTLLGQAERTGEDVRMTTYTEKNAFLTSDMQYTLGKASARVPGLEYQQIPYIDAWGRTEKTGGTGERAFNNFLNPAYMSRIEASAMEEELLRLYDETGVAGALPARAAKYFNVGGERKDLTAEEYVKYATTQGQTAYSLLTELTAGSAYKAMSDAEKADAVSKCYEYANAVAKASVSDYEPEGWVAKAINTGDTTGIKPEKYVTLYLQQKEVESLKDANGNTISNSKGLLIMQMIYSTSGLTDKQRQALFEDFGVGKTVRHYNKALVEEKLAEMKKKAG